MLPSMKYLNHYLIWKRFKNIFIIYINLKKKKRLNNSKIYSVIAGLEIMEIFMHALIKPFSLNAGIERIWKCVQPTSSSCCHFENSLICNFWKYIRKSKVKLERLFPGSIILMLLFHCLKNYQKKWLMYALKLVTLHIN